MRSVSKQISVVEQNWRMTKIKGYLQTVLLVVTAFTSALGFADDRMAYQYENMSYRSLGEAEDAMRADNLPVGIRLSEKGRPLPTGSSPIKWRHIYIVDDVPWQPDGQMQFSYSGVVTFPDPGCHGAVFSCSSEQEALSDLESSIVRRRGGYFPEGSICTFEITNSDPWIYTGLGGGTGSLNSFSVGWHRRVSYTFTYVLGDEDCSTTGSESNSGNVSRRMVYECPLGMGTEFVGVDPADDTDFESDWICHSDASGIIIAETVQTNDVCELHGNPCSVVTGNKHHAEVDFNLPGIIFSRNYSSLRQQAPAWRMAPGWYHSYQRHLIMSAGNPTPRFASGSTGFVIPLLPVGETFSSVAGEDILASVGDTSQVTTVTYEDGSIDEYLASGRLLRETDSAGRVTELNYEDGYLRSITGPYGHKLTLMYSLSSNFLDVLVTRLSEVHGPGGRVVRYQYDMYSRLKRVIHPDGTTTSYDYDFEVPDAPMRYSNHLTGISDETNQPFTSYDYDSFGRAAVSQKADASQSLNLSFDSEFRTTTTQSSGREVTYDLAPRGWGEVYKVTKMQDQLGSQIFDYELSLDRGRLRSETDEEGRITRYEYDALNLMAITEAETTAVERRTAFARNSESRKIELRRQPSVFSGSSMQNDIVKKEHRYAQ